MITLRNEALAENTTSTNCLMAICSLNEGCERSQILDQFFFFSNFEIQQMYSLNEGC